MNIILWIISPLIFIIGITGVAGLLAWFFNEIEWNNSWLDKMLIINMTIVLIILLLFGTLAGIWFIHEILYKILF
jgi:hypothetical protein